MTKTILIKRAGAMGDVLEVTPIVARLKAEDPDCLIDVDTHYAEVFKANNKVNAAHQSRQRYDLTIDLNMAFEASNRRDHPVIAYSEVAFGDRLTSTQLEFHWEKLPIPILPVLGKKIVVLHPARSWPIRTLPREFWQQLINCLNLRGFGVALTGTMQDWDGLTACLDLRSKLTLAQQAGLLDAASCFVCSESGPMILAQVTRVPIIPLLTMVPPEHVEHVRYSSFRWRWHPVQAPNVGCVGCAARQPEPTTYFDCEWGHTNPNFRMCVNAFDPDHIASLVETHHIVRAY